MENNPYIVTTDETGRIDWEKIESQKAGGALGDYYNQILFAREADEIRRREEELAKYR